MDVQIRNHIGHRWKFVRVGGVDQVDIRDGEDIINIENLDQKLWGALACPVENLEFDRRTLDLLDLDKDLRIRAPEIIEVIRWVKQVFKDANDLVAGGDSVELASINAATPAGAALQETARKVLATLGKEQATSITLAEVSDSAKIFAATDFNGDGIVPASSALDEATRKVIEDILATHGALVDRSGKPGINQAKLDAFLLETVAVIEWQGKGEIDPAVLPLGANTERAAETLTLVRCKIDDYFTRCRLAEFDGRYEGILNVAETAFAPVATRELACNSEEISRLPVASVKAARPLPLAIGLNPAWSAAIASFRGAAVAPLLGPGKAELSEGEWEKIKLTLAPFLAWMASKPKTSVEKLGIARLREIAGLGMGEKIGSLIQRDATFGVAADQITSLEKLVRVKRDLYRLLNNFVSFSDFYARRGAIFQAGTLYLDSRSCDLCVHVADTGKHALLAGMAKAYLAYLDCTRNGVKRVIAAAFTAGDSDHLMVGRNGVFYDRAGKDWDATITKIIENPISIRQAFLSPYKKFLRMIEEQIAKRAATADAAAQATLGETATKIAELKPVDPKAGPKKLDVGTVAALGVGLGSLGTFLALMFTKFIDLGWWAPLALVGILIGISGPSVLIAFLKLRQRNLGPILDANGWAVNGRMKINVPFGGALSKRAKLPAGAERSLTDPFVEKHLGRDLSILVFLLLILLPICWKLHLLDPILPPDLRAKPAAASQAAPTNTVVTPKAPQ